MIFRMILAAMFIVIAGVANAVDFEAGREAYERGDYATAFREFHPLAEQGLADAQFNLGFMHEQGKGVLEDFVSACAWFDLVAAQGDDNARERRDTLRDSMTRDQIAEA